ncbi:HIT family protein [Halorientalis pallida]|uniref:HIT family protein n=1 Tax=Halorientalis pallida TaxID=2479928 RepID=A0A498KWZ3_9EURY|nr:HIT family protein [Halorientalis pallida]RXK46440.1 HIT family protein [Halorientalis pallida]
MTDDCPFCAIVSGDAPASVVYETDDTIAFADIAPVTEGHTLVIPTAHSSGLAGLDPGTGGQLFRVGQEIAAALRASDVPTEGINLFLADGEIAGQEGLHVHLHVIPRTGDDGVTLGFERSEPGRDRLDTIADAVAAEL